MNCASCGRANRDAARFCGGCGGSLAPRCPACGAESAPDAQFCDTCGASLSARPAEAAVARKVVTIVFADLVGSTALHERLDAESARLFMERYYTAMRAAVEAHGGTVTQLLGDGVKAVFGAPRVAEDDAIRAVRAAVEMQRAFRELADEQSGAVGKTGLRVAVNTGEVVATDDTEIIGDPVNVAARLQEEARDGGVVIGESTRRLVADLVTLAPLGSFALKGRSEAVSAYRVVSLDRPAGAPAIAFVGRDAELARITAVYETAIEKPAACLAVLLGSPGLGKSRLLAEFARRQGDRATVLLAQCGAAGGATFAPLSEALRALLRIEDGASGDGLREAIEDALPGEEPERARIANGVAALLAGTPASLEEIFFAVRRLLAAVAVARPVLLAIDDLQWAEPLLLDLVEHLVQWSSGVPLLLLVAARPELRDVRSSLATPGGLAADVVTLAGLDAGAATRLAANVIGAEALPAAIAGRVLAASEGNPLFVGELVRMLVHDGVLKQEGERWTTGVALAGLEMPPTIHALLAARIERLRPEDRSVLERAAVVGRQFSRAAVAHLLPREATDLDARFEALRRSELIEPDAAWFLGEPGLRFHHGLIRDAAYRRVLKGTRAELHGRFADWVEAKVGEGVEHEETIGWHLEQAHQHLGELGPIDAPGRAVGERAARYLSAAGRRALARDDVPVAANLLGRALARLDAADPARAELALDWCEALLAAGDVSAAAAAIDELGRFTEGADRLRAWHTCFAGQLAVLTDPQALRATADAVAAAAEALASQGDGAGEAKAHSIHALALARLGKVGACEAALDRALAAARRVHDRRRSNGVLAGAPLAALWGPGPVTRASGRCLDVVRVLRITQGAPAVEAVALQCQGVLEALRGRSEAARRMIASSRHMVEELGITQRLLDADVFAGRIELLEGNAAAAERCLRSAYDGLRGLGLGIDAARAAALLGRAVLDQDRAAEAEALSYESESLAGDDLQAAIAWRGVRADALARRGEHAAAVGFARAAVEIAAATDALLDHADARLALAAALRAAGQSAGADAEEARAIELWEAKGATLLAERARRGRTASIHAARPPVEAVASPRANRPRVDRNHATLHLARLGEAVAAGDLHAVRWLLGEASVLDHVAGRSYGTAENLANFRWTIERSAGLAYGNEPIAVLGPSLALARWRETGSGVIGDDLPIGPFEIGGLVLIEADSEARSTHVEIFAAGKLGDAVARLYERYAELLPDGPERASAAATARSVATLLGPPDPDRWAAALAPSIEVFDFRTVGMGSVRGAEAVLRVMRALFELSADFIYRVDDILDLRSDALLVRWTNIGTVCASGGAFEHNLCALWIFGADGLVSRWDQFDADREAEALARFDSLLTGAKTAPRRVRANAATAHAAREDAVFVARDADALATLYADDVEVVDHPNGVTHDQLEYVTSNRKLLRAQDLTRRHEPLATLGDSLALCRLSLSSGGIVRGNFDVGAYEAERVVLYDVDAQGRCRRAEFFAADRVGDAIVRLYERYAELLPDGPERTRAAASARSLAATVGSFDLDRYAAAFAPAIEAVDHRTLGTWSARGAEALLEHFRSFLELVDAAAMRDDDVLSLHSDAFLLRRTHSGTDRAGGGAYERQFLNICVFGTNGFLTRIEWFDTDRDAEALARFDELTAEAPRLRPVRRVRPNAATANAARLEATVAARDAAALPALLADDIVVVNHATGLEHGREGVLFSFRSLLSDPDPSLRNEPLATLGDSLALCRWSSSASGRVDDDFDVGPYESVHLFLFEVDAQGRRARTEVFTSDHLGDAVARLYERYAELLPDGPARTRAAATARSIAACVGSFDLDRFATAQAPAIESVDHRTLGTWSARGAEALLQHYRSLLELADGVAMREDDILGLRSDLYLVRRTHLGTDRASGGPYERQFLGLLVFGTDGLVTRVELFDSDRDAEALARFDELAAGAKAAPRRARANAATANAARVDAAVAARDDDAFPILFADGMEMEDHSTHVAYDRQGELFSFRSLLRARDPISRHEPLASLGDSLALCRASISSSGFAGGKLDVGAHEREGIFLVEVDAQGRRRRGEFFATDHLGDAIARLYERYAGLLPDGPARTRAAATARSVAAMLGPIDVDRSSAALAPAAEYVDQRTLGLGSAHGAQVILRTIGAMSEVEENRSTRIDDVLDLRSDRLFVRRSNFGTGRASGGAYERSFLQFLVFGADGHVSRWEQFDSDREAEALARFDELAAEAPLARHVPRRVQPNAATANAARLEAAVAARDLEAYGAVFADDLESVHHPTGTTYGRQGALAELRSLLSARDPAFRVEPLASLGDSLALCRSSVSASGFAGKTFDVGPYESETFLLIEADAQERRRRSEFYASDHLGDAIARLYERHAELLPDGSARDRAAATGRSVVVLLGAPDPDRWATALAPGVEFVDHRPIGFGPARGENTILRGLRSLIEVAADVALRVDDVLGLGSNALLVLLTESGTDRVGGGAFERPFLVLHIFGADGLLTRNELFDVDHDTEALARFDELTTEALEPRFANAASRASEQASRAFKQRDWDALVPLYAPEHVFDDRRPLVRTRVEGEAYFAELRRLFHAWREGSFHLIATRGDRLVLQCYKLTSVSGDAGPAEWELLNVIEVDAAGRRIALVTFDLADLDAAYAELDARYGAGEASAQAGTWEASQRFSRVVSARDWEQWISAVTEDFVAEDHRLLGLGTRSRDEVVTQVRALVELAPDAMPRVDHVLAINHHGVLSVGRWVGSRDGGAFEIPFINVMWLGPNGRIRRVHTYDLDQQGAARACFDALSAEPPAPRIENAATRAADRFNEAWQARDWKRLAELFPEGFRCSDRKRMTQLELDRDQYLEFLRPLFEMSSSRFAQQALATRGDRLALTRTNVLVADRDIGSSEIASLTVIEVDEQGERVAAVRFDPDDLAAANAELDARYAAGEGARPDPLRIPPNAATRAGDLHTEAIQAGDMEALSLLCAPSMIFDDRRRGILLVGDRDLFLASTRHTWTARVSGTLLATAGERLSLQHLRWSGTLRGGDWEVENLSIHEVDAEGRTIAVIAFDPGDRRAAFDEMQARFVAGEAATTGAQAPVLAFSRAVARRDREAVRESLAPDFALHDRRMLVGGSYDRDHYVESLWTFRDLAPDAGLEEWRILAWNRHGRVGVGRSFGTTRDGVVFENVMIAVTLTRGDHIQHAEFFDVGDADRALARFEELCAARISTRRDAP